MQLKSASLSLCAFSVLASELPAQQQRDWPLCGIVAVDSLAGVQAGVGVRAWREELLGKAGARLADSLQVALQGTMSRLHGSTDSADAGTHRTPHKGMLWLELGVGRPRHGVTAVAGNWVLLVFGDTGMTIGWQKAGPLHVVPVDSLIEGVRREAGRLIEELPGNIERCRRLRDMPLDIRR